MFPSFLRYSNASVTCFRCRENIFYHEFPRLVEVGDKALLSSALVNLRTIPNIIDNVTTATDSAPSTVNNVWSTESILSILFNIVEQASHHSANEGNQSLTLSASRPVANVVEALDVCFDLAKMDPKLFPSDVSISQTGIEREGVYCL